jgi:hypothetical protein
MNVEATIRDNGSDDGNYVLSFANYIFSAKIIDEYNFNVISTDACADPRYGLRRLWAASGVSGHDLAAAAAEFFALRRAPLAELVSAPSLADRFSPRFLREVAIYPFATADRRPALAMGDPMDREARKAAELVFGEPVAVVVASFEDRAPDRRLRTGARRQSRQSTRPRQRRARGARRQRTDRQGDGAARQRHPFRAVAQRAGRPHARRRPPACAQRAARRSAASAGLPH